MKALSFVVDTGRKLVKEAMSDDITGLSAEMAFRLLLALFPFFIFLAALGAFVSEPLGIDDPTDETMELIGDGLPEDAQSVLRGQLESVLESKNSGLLTVGILLAIWSASNAMNTLTKALNRAYDVEETRPIWRRIPLSLALTVLAGIFFIGSFTALIGGQLFAREIGEAAGFEGTAADLFTLIRFPIVFILLTIAMAFVYWGAPNVDLPFRWVSPGAVFFIIAWILGTVGFAFYVSNFGSYQETYGTLGGLIVLLMWLYITSFAILLGAELNAVLHAQVEPETISGPVEQSGKPGEVAKQRMSGSASESPALRDARHSGSAPATVRGRPREDGSRAGGVLGSVLAGVTLWRALRRQATDGHSVQASADGNSVPRVPAASVGGPPSPRR